MGKFYDLTKVFVLKWLPARIVYQLKKTHYLRKVRSATFSDEPDLEIVARLVDHGDHVIDLGANIGVYSVFLSRLVGEGGRVYAFEPTLITYEILKNNIAKLQLWNVIAQQKAITDQKCVVTMDVPKDEGGADNFYQATVRIHVSNDKLRLRGGDVEGGTLDEAVGSDISQIKFVKCDVEGHELHCLRGATGIIERSKPSWLMEVAGDPTCSGSHASAVFAFMRRYNYSVWIFQRNRLSRWRQGMRSINYLFLQEGHVARLRASGNLMDD